VKLILTILTIVILPPILWGQDYIVDPDFADLGNRYYSRVLGIEYEPETDTYMAAGTFAGGSPFTPCLNRINHLGEDDFFWNPDPDIVNCDGINFNFFPTPIGYRFNGSMAQITDEGSIALSNIPDFSGTEQIVPNSPRGWADSNGVIYAGSNWRLLEAEGQPETGLLVFTPQGERYEPFPLIRLGHPEFDPPIIDIYEYDDDRLLLGGGFDSINGHLSIRMARIFKNGVVDTEFSSELEPHFWAFTLHVDPQGRVLVYHEEGGSEETPNDDLEIWRLLPDGSIDPSWNIVDLALSAENTGGFSARRAIYNEEDGSYFIYGQFNLVNGSPRTSICQIDSTGNLLNTFEDFPFDLDTLNYPQFSTITGNARILTGVKTPDGGLLLGGQFTHYQGQPYLNLIKLIPDSTVGTSDKDFPVQMKVYPNPTSELITVQVTERGRNNRIESIEILDFSGRTVASYPWQGDTQTIDIGHLANGVYLLQLRNKETVLGVEKLVVN
jgi:hypothetical protein